jgi:2-hydroxy-3-keto-5-methylthiopentenyl-1-phosphate phosphatase
MHVFCDFDGTITIGDATDHVLSNLADPQWLEIEEQWKAGHIGSGACMRAQVGLIRASRDELDAVLDNVAVDPGFVAFRLFCRSRGIPMSVVSDGVDYFVHRILAREGVDDMPVLANRLGFTEQGFELTSPYSLASCQSNAGTCKCSLVKTQSGPSIFVGDGRSDFCVSSKPDYVFAKGRLADFCTERGIDFMRYNSFHDITARLEAILSEENLMAVA